MRGQNRADKGGAEEGLQRRMADARLLDELESPPQRSLARRGSLHGMNARHRMGAGAADMVLVLGQVRQMREIAVGPDDLVGASARQAVQDRLELAAGDLILVAMEADRGLADALDDLEGRLALLLANRVAENASQKPDVVAKGKILLGRDVGIDQGHRRRSLQPHYAALRNRTLCHQRGKRNFILNSA